MIFVFLCPCCWKWHYFFFYGWVIFHCIHIHHIFFIHLSVDGYLGCLHVLAIVNSAAMNIGVQVSFQIIVFSEYMPRSGIAGSYGNSIFSSLRQGSPTPRPQTGTGPHSRRRAAGERLKLHLYLQSLPIAHITAWASCPVRSAVALDSHRSTNPHSVNCACEGTRLRAPYENLMPDDLRWSWGGEASTGEWLQIQIIISREVRLHRDHNKSIACRLISKPYQWVASENKLRAPTDSALWWVV